MRLLFLGFDGLDGRRCLSEGGVFERWDGLRCICEPEIAATGPSWMTIYTGVKAGVHGVHDTWGRDAKPGLPRLWDALNERGLRCGVVGMPVTHPAQRLDGWMVSGVPAPWMDDKGRWPVELDTDGYIPDYMNAVMPRGPEPGLWREHAKSPAEAWTVMQDVAWSHAQIAARLYARDRVDCLFVGFTFPDRFGHMMQGFGNFSETDWQPIDALAHKITSLFVERLAPDVAVVVSDHGFNTTGHTESGIMLMAGAGSTGPGRCNNWDVKRMVLEAICESS